MKTRFGRFAIISTAVIAVGLFGASLSLAAESTITDLGTFGGTQSQAWGINNLDEVVGLAYLPGDLVWHAFLYSGGVKTDLGVDNCTDPYGKSVARHINDSAQIVGTSCFDSVGTYAFLYSEGVMSNLGALGGGASDGYGINNWGHVVGSAATPSDATRHAFLYKDGVMTDIGIFISPYCCNVAYAINDYGQIVGEARTIAAGNSHAFLYSGGVTTDLTPGVGCCSHAYDINNSGQVVGQIPFLEPQPHAFLYSGGVLTNLGDLALGVGRSEAWGINDQGQIVGWSDTPGPVPHAFLYENGVMIDLNSLLPAGSGWVLNYALDINDQGHIAGVGTINGHYHAFLMVPRIPKIKLTPATLDFSIVTVGTSLTKEAKIENSGTADLTVTNITRCNGTSTEFSWSPISLPFTVSPGDSVTLSVTYDPQATGNDTGCVEISNNDPITNSVALDLTATGGFQDVPYGYWADDFIYAIYQAGITGGCSASPPLFCPNNIITRGQMAVFMEVSLGVAGAPPCTGTVFNDVNAGTVGSVFCGFIEDFAARGITGGCGGGKYCPSAPVSRWQMAVFIDAALGRVPGQLPPACSGTFNDVNASTVGDYVCRIIEDFSVQGITGGCGGGNFCPNAPVTRAQMAVFLVAAPPPLNP